MSYELEELSAKQFSEKIMELADNTNTSAKTMIGACLMILRALYSVLPSFAKADYCGNLERFARELQHQNPEHS